MPDVLSRSHERKRVDDPTCRAGARRHLARMPPPPDDAWRPAPAARLFALLLLVPGALLLGGEAPAPSAQAFNWVLPIFTDQEGYRSLTARGSEVRPEGRDAIAVVDFNLTVFSGDAAARVESIMLSPLATFFPKENRAAGDRGLRIIRDDLEAAGERWTYDHAEKHVTLEGGVRIVFNAELDDLLK